MKVKVDCTLEIDSKVMKAYIDAWAMANRLKSLLLITLSPPGYCASTKALRTPSIKIILPELFDINLGTKRT
jgi:hypothetical protein